MGEDCRPVWGVDGGFTVMWARAERGIGRAVAGASAWLLVWLIIGLFKRAQREPWVALATCIRDWGGKGMVRPGACRCTD